MKSSNKYLISAFFACLFIANGSACYPQQEENRVNLDYCDEPLSLMWGLHWLKKLENEADLHSQKSALLVCNPEDPALKLVLYSALANISTQQSDTGEKIRPGRRYRDKITSRFLFEDPVRRLILKEAKSIQSNFDFETTDIDPNVIALMEWYVCNDDAEKNGLIGCGTDFEPYRKRAELKFPKVRRSYFKGGIDYMIGQPDQPGPETP